MLPGTVAVYGIFWIGPKLLYPRIIKSTSMAFKGTYSGTFWVTA